MARRRVFEPERPNLLRTRSLFYLRSMRFLLPIILLIVGLVLSMPLIRVAMTMANSGTPDATAVSMDQSLVIRGGIGVLLMTVGLVLVIVRISRRSPAHSE